MSETITKEQSLPQLNNNKSLGAIGGQTTNVDKRIKPIKASMLS